MSEMMIRRNNRGIPVARYPAAGKAEKTQDSAPAQKTTRTGGVTVSDTLRQLMQRVSQTGPGAHWGAGPGGGRGRSPGSGGPPGGAEAPAGGA